MTRYSRDEIGLRPPEGRTLLDPREVRGIALHWPGMSRPLRTVDAVKDALCGWQIGHMDTDQIAEGGASDIAYQEAIDNRGNTYRLRGLRYRSGANGDYDLNSRYGALLLVIAPGEPPSLAMIRAIRRRIARHRAIFPSSRLIVGHGEIRPGGTQCPGPLAQRLIDAGTLNPPPRKRTS